LEIRVDVGIRLVDEHQALVQPISQIAATVRAIFDGCESGRMA
jgi:hypothetical protein